MLFPYAAAPQSRWSYSGCQAWYVPTNTAALRARHERKPVYSDQVVRNAFIIAQSQLLQLAKQMEFDADTSRWEDDVEETMREFWQQAAENIDTYCARMSNGDDLRQVTADVVKSPRKNTPARPQIAPEPASPLSGKAPQPPALDLQPERPAERDARASHTHTEPDAASDIPDKVLDAPQEQGQEQPKEQAQEIEQPERPEPKSAHVPEDAAHAPKEQPSPPRSASPPAEPILPALTPATGPRIKRTLTLTAPNVIKQDAHASAAVPRSRPSDTVGKRFRSSFLNKSLRQAIEERATHDSDDEAEVHDDERRERPELDSLRTRLENVRRASAGLNAPITKPIEPPSEDTPEPATKPKGTEIPEQKPEPKPVAESATPAPPKPKAMPASLSASTSAAHLPTESAQPSNPLASSTSRVTRPVHTQLPRSPNSTVGLSRSVRPATPKAPARPLSSLERVGRGVDSPSRLAQPVAASPWRIREAQATKPQDKLASSTSRPARPGSPGRLRDELLSPFRGNSVRVPSPFGKRTALGPPKSPVLSASTPASQSHGAQDRGGLSARIKGLFGMQSTAPRASPKPATPAGTGNSRPRPASPSILESPELPSAARLSSGLDDGDTSFTGLIPGSFDDGRSGKIPQLGRSVQAPAPKAAPSTNPLASSTSALHTSTPARTRGLPAHRPAAKGMRVSSQPRIQIRPPTHASTVRAEEVKRRKMSHQKQPPLSEATNQPPPATSTQHPGTTSARRISTEDALKSKLTTQPQRPANAPKGTTRDQAHVVRTSVARVASGTRAGGAPPTRTSTMNNVNVFQQQPARQPDTSVVDELPDVASEYSDSEDEASVKKRKAEPSWTRGRELENQLLQQSTVDPDEIFGLQLGPVPLDAMLPPRKGDRRRMRHRTSSANWSGPDGLAQWEIDRYNERMGISASRARPPYDLDTF